MEDTSNSKLTLFARLWPVSVVLFFAFCIMFAFGVVDYKKVLIGISAIGIILSVSAQLAQFVVSIILKRWWCMAGVIVGMVISCIIFLFTVVALAAGQYRPPVRNDLDEMVDTIEVADYSFPVEYKGKTPTISELVTAILSQEENGEALDEMNENWQKYLKHKTLPKGKTLLVDTKKAYVHYESDLSEAGEEVNYKNQIEFCSWDFNDVNRKLLIKNIVCYQDGEPIEGQYSGLVFYVFDQETQRMEYVYDSDLGAEIAIPAGTEVVVHKLDVEAKTIEFQYIKPDGRESIVMVWNGENFEAQ